MKRTYSLGMPWALIVLAAAAAVAVAGEWEDELPIVQDPLDQIQSWITVGPDDDLYAIWLETIKDVTDVWLTRSTDKGHTWSTPVSVVQGPAYVEAGLLAAADGLHLLLVEFEEDPFGEYQRLYHAKSVDGGQTFSPLLRVGGREGMNQLRFFADGGTLYIYARDYGIGSEDDYLYVSTDGGLNWHEKPLFPGITVDNPGFTTYDGVLHLAFRSYGGSYEIQHCMSADMGDTWTTPVQVSQNAGRHSQLAKVAVEEKVIHVAWEDDRQNNFNIMYSSSIDGGQTWSPDVPLNMTYYGARVQLLADEEGLHAVWCQYHGPGWPSSWSSADYGILWYRFSRDGGINWTDEYRVSQNEQIPPLQLPDLGANYVRLLPYRNGFAAVWQDKRGGNVDLLLRNNLGLLIGDLNCDGKIDFGDINPFVLALTDPNGYAQAFPDCNILTGDINQDGKVDFGDINPFVALLTQP